MQVTVFFAIFINVYWYHERIRGLSTTKRFADAIGWSFGPLLNSGIAYWVGIYLWKMFIPPPSSFIPSGIPNSLADLGYLLAEVVSGIILYDAIFFFIHWAMHTIPSLKGLHHQHHRQQIKGKVECRDTLRHSLWDGALQVGINILVQRSTPWGCVKSLLSRCLHNLIVIWMLVESHSASPYPNIWRRYCKGVRNHQWHHRYSHQEQNMMDNHDCHCRYQQFFGYLDDTKERWCRGWNVKGRVAAEVHTNPE